MSDKLKVGIAGYGVVGKRRRHFIDSHPNLVTTAVCDQNFESNISDYEGVKAFNHYKELIEEPLDILFVCVPNYLAPDVTIEALDKKMHVFCEKPPGRTVGDIERVIEAETRNKGLVLKYGFNHRYHDSVRDALGIVESKDLGEIINLRGVYGKSKVVPATGGWRSQRKYSGGGILLDQGIHMVDLIRLFGGEFDEIKSFVSNDYWNHDVEDNAYAIMRSAESGRIAMLHSSATQWEHHFSLYISLTKGYLKLSGLLTSSKSYGEENLLIGKKDERDHGALREKRIKYLEDNSWKDEVFEFAEAVLQNKEILNGSSSDALNTMKLVYNVYEADESWKKYLDETSEVGMEINN